jgi:flagellin
MSLNISTNTAAARAGLNLSKNSRLLQKSFDRLASGRRLSSPMDDPGGLAVSMKLQASINRLSGAQSNVQNAMSFLEVQDGMLDTVGKIIDRMSELKGLASQDPMKSTQDRASYNNEFKDLQSQLFDLSQMKFNGVSLFAQYASKDDGTNETNGEAVFKAEDQGSFTAKDNTLTIYTSAEGAAGSKVSLHKSLLLSALTIHTNTLDSAEYTTGTKVADGNSNADGKETTEFTATLAASAISGTINLADVSVGVFTKALENISFLRAQNGGVQSRMAFNLESLGQQKTNMMAALGRIVDVDIAEETTNLSKYSILQQAAASMLAQANQSSDVALMLLR